MKKYKVEAWAKVSVDVYVYADDEGEAGYLASQILYDENPVTVFCNSTEHSFLGCDKVNEIRVGEVEEYDVGHGAELCKEDTHRS